MALHITHKNKTYEKPNNVDARYTKSTLFSFNFFGGCYWDLEDIRLYKLKGPL